MIYLFTGSDAEKVRAKAFQWVAAARTKAPDAAYLRFSAGEVSKSSLNEVLGAQGLFYAKALVLLDDPFSESESAEIVLGSLDTLKDSPNAIAILAPKLLAARVKKVSAAAEKVFTVDAAPKRDRGFNGTLVNALGARDGKLLWKEIVKAYRLGDAPEVVHGLLHWKARDMMQKGSRVWAPEEARTLSLSLIELLSDARGKDLELSPALERFALSLGKR